MLETLTLKLHLQGVRLSLLHMQLPKSLTKQTIEQVMRSQQYMIWKEKRSVDYHTAFYIHSFIFFFFWMESILHSFLIVNLTETRIQIYCALQNQPTSFLKWKTLQKRKKNKKITHLHDTYGDNLYKNSIRKAKFLNLKFYNTSWFQL